MLDFNQVFTLNQVEANAVHVGSKGSFISNCQISVTKERMRGFKYLFVLGALVYGVSCAAFIAILHTHMNRHFINARFGNHYAVNDILTRIFGYVPVLNIYKRGTANGG